jgi:hypothetical protein
MNCQIFGSLLTDLVREEGLDESVRSQALAHAGDCQDCSARLAHHGALRAVTRLAAAEREEAPAYLEGRLLSIYRQRQANGSPGAARQHSSRALPTWYWGVAAALAVALLGVATYRMFLNPPSYRVAGPLVNPAPPAVPPPVFTPAPAPAALQTNPVPVTAQAAPAAKKAAPRKTAAETTQADSEVATDFFSLTTGNDLSSMESAQLVRVLMPRNVMASYGLPVNPERIDNPVTAQVLIGQDGVARAIRFLSEPNTNFVQTGMRTKR